MEKHDFVSERVQQPYHTLDKRRVVASGNTDGDTCSRVAS